MESRLKPDIRALHDNTGYWGWVQGMYLAKNDCGIALRLYNGFEYEPQSRKLWKSLCKDTDLVIDVGAHTGLYTLEAYRAGAKQVLSLEPYHMNYARLVMNLRHEGFSPEGAVLCAAGDENGLSRFSVNTPHYYCSTGGYLSGEKDGVTQYAVEVRSLDTLLHADLHSRVRAVKIDTENHGVRVLRGMSGLLSYKPDLILECTESGLDEMLKPLGYQFFKINEKTGLEPVDGLTPDAPFTFDSPNRYATVRGLNG